MKIGGDFGGISRRIARIHFLESLEDLRPDIINELDILIVRATEISKDLLQDIDKKFEEIKTEEDETYRVIDEYEKYNPCPQKDPDAPTLQANKMTDEEWLRYKEQYRKDHGEELNEDAVTREKVNDWRKELDGTTKEQRVWFSNYADLFDGVKETLKKFLINLDHCERISRTDGFYIHLQETEIKAEVDKWAARHNLDPWVSDAALYTVSWWTKTEEPIGEDGITMWAIYASIESSLDFVEDQETDGLAEEFERRTPKMSFVTPFAYNPITGTKGSYKKHMMKMLETKLEKYIAEIEADVEKIKIPKTRDTRNMERFDWLVRYQVCGESYREIAESLTTKEENLNERIYQDIIESNKVSVRNRVRETAKYCGITLRPPGKAGRPIKK